MRVLRVAFSSDGKSLAWGSADGTIAIWDVAKKAERIRIQAHSKGVRSLAFSPDSQILASGGNEGGNDRAIRFWHVQTGGGIGPILSIRSEAHAELAFSPDGRLLAVTDYGSIRLYDVPGCQLRHTLASHRFWMGWLGFSPDGKMLVSGGNNRTITFWDLAAGKERKDLEQKGDNVNALSLGPLVQSAELLDLARPHVRITVHLGPAFESPLTTTTRHHHPLANLGRRLTGPIPGDFPKLHLRHFHVDVDAVKQWTTDPAEVVLDLAR